MRDQILSGLLQALAIAGLALLCTSFSVPYYITITLIMTYIHTHSQEVFQLVGEKFEEEREYSQKEVVKGMKAILKKMQKS